LWCPKCRFQGQTLLENRSHHCALETFSSEFDPVYISIFSICKVDSVIEGCKITSSCFKIGTFSDHICDPLRAFGLSPESTQWIAAPPHPSLQSLIKFKLLSLLPRLSFAIPFRFANLISICDSISVCKPH
jgi:hypothetical protein